MSRITAALLSFATLTALIPGCGGHEFGALGSVSGKLTLDGKPLASGTKVIFMQPTQGYSGFGITNAAGEYSIEWRRSGTTYDGLPVGNYQVMLVSAGAVDIDDVSAEDMLAGGPKQSPAKADIPAKYLRTSTSGLTYDIAEGENKIDIQATSK